jgi:hypothetical protein
VVDEGDHRRREEIHRGAPKRTVVPKPVTTAPNARIAEARKRPAGLSDAVAAMIAATS